MDELKQVKILQNDLSLFDEEFVHLKEFYRMNNENEIRNFIKQNPGLIILLGAYKNSLKKYFSNAIFELKFDPDISGSWFDLLELNVWVDENTFNNGSMDYILSIDKELFDLRKKLNLLGEISLSKRILK